MAGPTRTSRAGRRWRSSALPEPNPGAPASAKPVTPLAAGDDREPVRVTGGAGRQYDFADLFERAPVGYLVLDDAGRIERINRTGADILGWHADWLHGKPFPRWVASRDQKLFHAHRRRLRGCESRISQELRIKNRQGRFVSLRLESVREDASVGGSRSIMIDISGEQQSARRVRRLQSQLSHLTRLHTAGELASSLAHELNQPLGTVVLNCEAAMRLLRSEATDKGECIEALSQATEAASFASEVIRHLRGFLRKNGELPKDCKLRSMIGDVVTLIETDARDNDIDLQIDIERNLPFVHVDPVQIEQVLVNLTHNSVEAMGDTDIGGPKQLLVRVRFQRPDRVRVSVADTGPGLSARQIDRIFSPFYTTKADGMGMGLSISRTIIEAHGGKLWVDPESGNGALFHFTLPTVGEGMSNDAN